VELEKQTERLIKLTIPISRETFLDPTFNPYILGLFKKYGVPYEFVRLRCDMDLRASHYSNQIQELIDHGISLDTTSLDMALSYPFNALHVELKKENIKLVQEGSKKSELISQYNLDMKPVSEKEEFVILKDKVLAERQNIYGQEYLEYLENMISNIAKIVMVYLSI